MSKVPAIVPISDLRGDAAEVLDRVKKSHEPVVITQRGRAAAVMVSVEEYQRSEHEREVLRLLVQGDKEAAAGKGHDLEDVLEEADRILARRRNRPVGAPKPAREAGPNGSTSRRRATSRAS